jgi:hypothetical protein
MSINSPLLAMRHDAPDKSSGGRHHVQECGATVRDFWLQAQGGSELALDRGADRLEPFDVLFPASFARRDGDFLYSYRDHRDARDVHIADPARAVALSGGAILWPEGRRHHTVHLRWRCGARGRTTRSQVGVPDRHRRAADEPVSCGAVLWRRNAGRTAGTSRKQLCQRRVRLPGTDQPGACGVQHDPGVSTRWRAGAAGH